MKSLLTDEEYNSLSWKVLKGKELKDVLNGLSLGMIVDTQFDILDDDPDDMNSRADWVVFEIVKDGVLHLLDFTPDMEPERYYPDELTCFNEIRYATFNVADKRLGVKDMRKCNVYSFGSVEELNWFYSNCKHVIDEYKAIKIEDGRYLLIVGLLKENDHALTADECHKRIKELMS